MKRCGGITLRAFPTFHHSLWVSYRDGWGGYRRWWHSHHSITAYAKKWAYACYKGTHDTIVVYIEL